KLGSPQFLWKCAPVNPKPRPPSGRSTAQARTSSRPLASTMCWYGPRGDEERPSRVRSSGLAMTIGKTPFIDDRNRMLKYHSSFTANGGTPLVMGGRGRVLPPTPQGGLVK